jgi:hypothetical protein
MQKLRWPTYPEWGLLIVIAAALACFGFSFLVAYNGLERAGQNLEEAGRPQEREVPSHHR